MTRRDEVTSRVRLTGFVPGDPPAILVADRARRSDGRERVIMQQIPVADSALWQNLVSTAREGQDVEITVVTDWTDAGYTTSLRTFRALTPAEPALASG